MNIDTKILNKMLVNLVQKHIKCIKYHDQVRFIHGYIFQYMQVKSCDTSHNKLENTNHMIISIAAEKVFFTKYNTYL